MSKAHKPLAQRTLQAGEVLIREGDTDSVGYRVLSGMLEVYRIVDGTEKRRAFIYPGEVLGEIGLLLERPRMAHVRAVTDTLVEAYDTDDLNRLMRTDIDAVMPILQALFERMRKATVALDEVVPPPWPDDEVLEQVTQEGQLTLVAVSSAAKRALGPTGMLKIDNLPFRIGRATKIKKDLFVRNDLRLADREPYAVSRSHCEIDYDYGREMWVVRDRGTHGGTV